MATPPPATDDDDNSPPAAAAATAAATNMADDEDAQPEVLEPCAVCGRKFNPRSLDKHVRICERTAARKRKPFDSAKQRIKGTELAEFLPKQQHQQPELSASSSTSAPGASCGRKSGGHADDRIAGGKRPNNAWKQTRDEFLRAIRAARGDSVPAPSQHQQQHHNHNHHNNAHHSSPSAATHASHSSGSHQAGAQQRPSTLSLVQGPPTRANEKGQCPTCQRQFGVKSYDRHVAFCRERATRLPASPQTSNNVAKERLDARMKYRAPALKNRKPTNREKYSPGAAHKTQSPMMARSPMKDVAEKEKVKSAETCSPKLPMLKRPGQTTKESPVASNGPLKSRPIDRSNRFSSDSQDSLNPPVVKQLFSSRRLLLLSEVLPSKILQAKNCLSSSSSKKSSARLISHFLQKESADDPLLVLPETSEVIERKSKKRLKLKIRGHRKVKAKEEIVERVVEKVEEQVTMPELSRQFITWQQIREEADKNKEAESIDKVSMPAMSDITGLSSVEEGNSTTDEFEFNERMVSRCEARKYAPIERTKSRLQIKVTQAEESTFPDNSSLNASSLNRTYVIRNKAAKAEPLSRENQDSLNTLNSAEKTNIDDSDDDEEGLSSASTKTFRKSDRSAAHVDFVDSLDQCQVQLHNNPYDDIDDETPRLSEESNTTFSKSHADCDSRAGDGKLVDENKPSEPTTSSLSQKARERLLPLRPLRSFSLPNIGKAKVDAPVICVNLGDKNNDRSLMGDPDDDEIDIREGSPTPRNTPSTPPNPVAHPSRRCATYVINANAEAARNPSPVGCAESSEDNKPLKKRRKLQQQQDASKNEPAPPVHENKEERYVLYDYYRNDAASFSDASSFGSLFSREADEVCAIEDGNMRDRGVVYGRKEEEEQDEMEEVVSRMRTVDLAAERPRTDGRVERRKCKNVRINDTYTEETSVSTIELTDLAVHRPDKPVRHFEKEICTITRLDAVNQDSAFLPNINKDWPSRTKYRREKLAKSRPQSLRGIVELETPREDDELEDRNERRSRSSQTSCTSFLRRGVHADRRSGADKDYNPFLLAEQQLNDLFSDTSDQSSIDGSAICPPQKPNSSPTFPLSPSSAFVKYPPTSTQLKSAPPLSQPQQQPQQQQQQNGSTDSKPQPQRISLIAPPTGFDDLTSSDLSSDCTETNSLSRELLSSSSNSTTRDREHVFGRKVIIDQSQALGGGEFAPSSTSNLLQTKLTNGTSSRVARPIAANRSNSMRSASAPKPPERKISSSSSSGSSDFSRIKPNPKQLNKSHSVSNDTQQQTRGANYKNALNGSNLSLSSIISSTDLEMKRSNSLFDELLSSFEDDANSTSTLPSLISLMRNDTSMSLLSSSTGVQPNGVNGHHHHHQRGMANGRICSDDDAEMSSPESVKRQEGGKLSADSAYSSLNRKYSSANNHHNNNNTTGPHSTNDVSSAKMKMSKFCHECGFKFPDSAKFCCECGVKRLTL